MQFRRKVLDLLAQGRAVKHVAEDLDLSMQTVYNWQNHEAIDRGDRPGLSRAEQGELTATKRPIRELEDEVKILTRARELLEEAPSPKGFTRPSRRWPRSTARSSGAARCWTSQSRVTARGFSARPRTGRSDTRGR